MASSAQENPLE